MLTVACCLALLGQINAVRHDHGRAPLRADPRLERTASAWSDKICARPLAHGNFHKRIWRTGLHAYEVGEVIARTTRDPVEAWMGSPGHRKVLLSSRWRRVGAGACGLTVTADFARRNTP